MLKNMPEHHLGEIYEHRNPPPIEGKESGLWCHHPNDSKVYEMRNLSAVISVIPQRTIAFHRDTLFTFQGKLFHRFR